MLLGIIISALVCLLLIIICIKQFNALTQARNLVETAFSDIDVQLFKRQQLVPNLVSLTKGYAAYESSTLETLVQNRSKTSNTTETAHFDGLFSAALKQIRVNVEAYPELKANHTFAQLMEDLSEIEDHLLFARRFYNGTTREYNTTIERFPSSIIAGIFGFKRKDFYVVANEDRAVPDIQL